MANLEQLKIIKTGRKFWNDWRSNNYHALVDLSSVDLSNLDLSHLDLKLVDLSDSNLSLVNLTGSDLSGSLLRNTNISGSTLDLVNFDSTDLSNANMVSCSLRNAKLISPILTGTIFNEDTVFHKTVFKNVYLNQVVGLEKCFHEGRSSIDVATLEIQNDLPLQFLRGCGIPDRFIDICKANPSPIIEYYSCFISYSHADKDFANLLYNYLQEQGIRCWLDKHQLLPGDDPHSMIQEAIQGWDKILLCCSEHSMCSWWVDNEIETTFNFERTLMREHRKKILKLIPINLDGIIFSDAWENGKKEQILSRMAANFVGWEKRGKNIESPLSEVVAALRCDLNAREKPPPSRLV